MIKEIEHHPLKPIEISLGNFIDSMGKVEIVTGIVKLDDGSFQIAHNGWGAGTSFIPEGVLYETRPILLTEEWKVCLGIEKFDKLPKWVKYVHQAQNYFTWALEINLLEVMNWDLLPKDGNESNEIPHEVSKVKCDLCEKEWIAVRPEGLDKLECPNCGNIVNFDDV